MTEEEAPQTDGEGGSGTGAPDLTAVSAEEFAAIVATATDDQLAEAMTGPGREPALREIFRRMEEHFNPNRAKGQDAVVHFQILDRSNDSYDEFEVVVRDGKCTVSETPSEQPRVTLKVDPVDFLRLITNPSAGPTLFMSGKLTIEGDLMFAPQVASFFHIPTAPKQEGSN